MFEVLTEPGDLIKLCAPRSRRRHRVRERQVVQHPKTRVPVEEEVAGRLLRLGIDALEDNDDVGEVHGNFDVDAAVLERWRPSRSCAERRLCRAR